MGDPYKKVQTGQRLEIGAGTYNAFLDTVRDLRGRLLGFEQESGEQFRQGDIIRVRNDSGEDRQRFEVLGLDAPIIDPATSLREFKNQVALAGVKPQRPNHAGRFALLLEPLGQGKIGRAYVAGVCPAYVDVLDDCHQCADIKHDDATVLQSCPAGSARILWREGGTGLQWAVVLLAGTDEAMRRFVLSADLDACGSAVAQRVLFQNGQWCQTDCQFEVYDALGVVCPGGNGGNMPAGTHGWARWMPDSERWEVVQLGEGCCSAPPDSISAASATPVTITETDVRCESGKLNVYVRTVTLDLSCGRLSKTEGTWSLSHQAGCCDCDSSGGPEFPCGSCTAVPETLVATFTEVADCSCLNGVMVSLTYTPTLPASFGGGPGWYGSFPACNCSAVEVAFFCNSPFYTVEIHFDACFRSTGKFAILSCEPFDSGDFGFSSLAACDCTFDAGCSGTVNVRLTE